MKAHQSASWENTCTYAKQQQAKQQGDAGTRVWEDTAKSRNTVRSARDGVTMRTDTRTQTRLGSHCPIQQVFWNTNYEKQAKNIKAFRGMFPKGPPRFFVSPWESLRCRL